MPLHRQIVRVLDANRRDLRSRISQLKRRGLPKNDFLRRTYENQLFGVEEGLRSGRLSQTIWEIITARIHLVQTEINELEETFRKMKVRKPRSEDRNILRIKEIRNLQSRIRRREQEVASLK